MRTKTRPVKERQNSGGASLRSSRPKLPPLLQEGTRKNYRTKIQKTEKLDFPSPGGDDEPNKGVLPGPLLPTTLAGFEPTTSGWF